MDGRALEYLFGVRCEASSGRRDRSQQWGVRGGVWSKMGKGEVARTVGPFGHGALTPTYFCTQNSEEGSRPWCSISYQLSAAEHPAGTAMPQKMLCHSSQPLRSATLPSSGQGERRECSHPCWPQEAGGREENENVCGSVHRFPMTFRDEGGPCLLLVQKWWVG